MRIRSATRVDLADDDEEEDENDYNERYGSDAEGDGDGADDGIPLISFPLLVTAHGWLLIT